MYCRFELVGTRLLALGKSCFCNGIFMLFEMMDTDFSWIYRTVNCINPKLLACFKYLM